MNKYDKKVFSRRVYTFICIEIVIIVALLLRLAYLQIFQASHYKLLSDRNRIVTKQILPHRGLLLDSSGEILANNRAVYTAVLDLSDLASASERIVFLQNLSNLYKVEFKQITEQYILTQNKSKIIIIKEDLTWQELSMYSILSSYIPEITIEQSELRNYIFPLEFAHILGYIGAPNDSQYISLPTAKVGKTCIEKEYEDKLFGNIGLKHEEVNSKRQFVRQIDFINSVNGEDLQLTINKDLQIKVYEILSQHQSAACVVLDVHTGAILACVSFPGYDINIFSRKVEKSELNEIYSNPYKPILNKITTGLYSPGSAFKLITALTALQHGVVDENTQFNCSVYEVGNHKFHCWKEKYGGHGSVNLHKALTESCDIYFYQLAHRLMPEMIAKTANDFGLGCPTNIDLPFEKSGLIGTRKWKKRVKKHVWTTGDTINMSIGQGFILSTPLQLARMMAIFVNGLHPITPHIISKKITNNNKLSYNKKHIQLIIDSLYDTVNTPTGTAFGARLQDKNFLMAGKTGSTQVCRITEEQRKLGQTGSNDYWKKEHAIFIGFAPVDEPKFAVAVLVEHGGSGAKTAAPIARDVLLEVQKICF